MRFELFLLIIAVLFIGSCNENKKQKANEINYQSAHGLLPDIMKKLYEDFPDKSERVNVENLLGGVLKEDLNVGNVQLVRAILIIAKGDESKVKNIIDSKYSGDPRDILMEAQVICKFECDFGLKPFE